MECATQEMIYNKTGQYSVDGGGAMLYLPKQKYKPTLLDVQ